MDEVQPPFSEELRALDKDFGLWLRLVRTKDVIHRAREKELSAGGIDSSTQAAILFLTRELGDRATPAEISRHLFRKSHGISTVISRMESKGLIKKVKDLDRKNLVRVEVTEKGWKAYDYAAKLTSIHRIMSTLSQKEHHEVNVLLDKLCDRAAEELKINKDLLKRTLPLGY